ncbi:serine/threonine-protein kinase pim-2-like [Chaetodon auriga]|uniref:serine/threonine-protein kinase pim-2-like n=1 Tax=Chaetodon auriga TaxID=39042 RepID=UPI004032C82E
MSSQRGGNTTHTTDRQSNGRQEDVLVRKRTGDDVEMPRKRMRLSNLSKPIEHSQVSVEDTRIQHGKRKASADGEAPKKRSRCGINTASDSDPSVVLVEDTRIQNGKRKASADGEAPKKKRCTAKSSTSQKTKSTLTEEERIFVMSSIQNTSRDDFQDKYCQLKRLGTGGFGSVFNGFRKSDKLPVAIKHIPSKTVRCQQVSCKGKKFYIILEVAFMLKAAGLPRSIGKSAAVSLLDWYIRDQELILVMERPKSSMDLYSYLKHRGGSLDEKEAKIILKQLVDAAMDMHSKGVFHRDIKLQNVLVQLDSDVPRVRIIDFGCACFSSEMTFTSLCGTRAYFPPEWFDSKTYKARPTTVYQLGVLFYLLLKGHPYFTTWHYFSERIQVNDELSSNVRVLLYRCLTRDPAWRVFLQDLQSHPALRDVCP